MAIRRAELNVCPCISGVVPDGHCCLSTLFTKRERKPLGKTLPQDLLQVFLLVKWVIERQLCDCYDTPEQTHWRCSKKIKHFAQQFEKSNTNTKNLKRLRITGINCAYFRKDAQEALFSGGSPTFVCLASNFTKLKCFLINLKLNFIQLGFNPIKFRANEMARPTIGPLICIPNTAQAAAPVAAGAAAPVAPPQGGGSGAPPLGGGSGAPPLGGGSGAPPLGGGSGAPPLGGGSGAPPLGGGSGPLIGVFSNDYELIYDDESDSDSDATLDFVPSDGEDDDFEC
jgi:hypothetical protein